MNNMNENALLQEIEEDLARQRYEKLWRKYGAYVLGAAIMIVAATAAFTGYKSYKLQNEQKVTAAYIDLIFKSHESKDDLVAKFQQYAQDNKNTTQSAFAQLKAADAALAKDQKDQARKIYDDLAADTRADVVFRQLADMMAVQIQLDTGDGPALETRLQPLMADDCVWRFTAKELAGYLAVRLGNKEKAKALFTELKSAPGVPASIAARSGDVLVWLNEGA